MEGGSFCLMLQGASLLRKHLHCREMERQRQKEKDSEAEKMKGDTEVRRR